jgi:hypothetical protein
VSERNTDSFIDQIAAELRRPVRLDARFDDRVMAAIEQPDVIPLRRSMPLPWTRRRWTISVSPLGASALAASIIGFVALGLLSRGRAEERLARGGDDPSSIPVTNVASDPENALQYHQFLIVAPEAKSIVVEGGFNDWVGSRTQMTRSSDGVWTASVLLRPGQHQYQFVIDDTLRVPDPRAPSVPDGLGGQNSVVTIAPRVQ